MFRGLVASTASPQLSMSTKAGGRQKGTPNRMTSVAKEAFALAFDEIGGAEALADWARENRTDFYKLFSKLIPVDTTLSGPDGEELSLKVDWGRQDAP